MDNPSIEWINRVPKKTLRFTFNGRLTQQEAADAIDKWRKNFGKSNEKFVLIWNCLKMNGYDSDARNLWQHAIKDMKGQIECIWLITDSTMIRMGASVMALFASFKIQTVTSEEEIKY